MTLVELVSRHVHSRAVVPYPIRCGSLSHHWRQVLYDLSLHVAHSTTGVLSRATEQMRPVGKLQSGDQNQGRRKEKLDDEIQRDYKNALQRRQQFNWRDL